MNNTFLIFSDHFTDNVTAVVLLGFDSVVAKVWQHRFLRHSVTYVYYVQLDQTKTTDGKSNFMNMLANAVYSRHPEAIDLAAELPTVSDAARGQHRLLYGLLHLPRVAIVTVYC